MNVTIPDVQLPANIVKQQQIVTRKETELVKAQERLAELIEEFQSGCEHPFWKDVMIGNPEYESLCNDEAPQEILDYKQCTTCGKQELPRQGPSWQVCRLCAGDMVRDRYIPGQGGDGYWIYKCASCEHEAKVQ